MGARTERGGSATRSTWRAEIPPLRSRAGSFRSWLLRDAVPALAVVLSLLYLWSPPLPWIRDGTIYVSPDGSDWNTGRSPESAVSTIQRAADMVAPGEIVVVLPGVYRETVRVRRGGKPGRPVTFRAETPGTVTITGAAPDSLVETLEWRNEDGSIWSARSPWPVYHVVVDGLNLYHVRWGDTRKKEGERGKVGVLREVAAREGAWPAFTHERGRLYLALPDGRPPGKRAITIHRPIPPPYASWTIRSANVWVEADHVTFEGLRFEVGVGAGLLLWSARHVTVRGCLFSGTTHGIRSFPSVRRPDGLRVEHSLYHNYPQAYWLAGWLSWKEAYRHHAFSTLVNTRADDIVVAHNVVAHGGDGLQLTTPLTGVEGIEIYGNLLFRGTDDAIQLDGYARNVFIHDNLVYDWFVSLGISPVLAGPVLAERNLFLRPDDGVVGAHLKFLNPWNEQEGERVRPIRNVAVTGNLFVGGAASWANGPGENVIVARNLFALETPVARWPEGSLISDNEFVNLGERHADSRADCSWAERMPAAREGLPEIFARLRERERTGREVRFSRPGPSWFDYSDLPATAEVAEGLSAELVEWRC